MRAWVQARAPAAAALAARRDADGPVLDRALARVRAFLAKRSRVVFGGLAIDYALRLRGAAIYPDDERPDFDALSPEAVSDAYDLADELHRAGFARVDAIRAVHVQTMRVRVDYRPVADLGYVPPDVYEHIPTLAYKDLRIAHPDYQRMDMHLAFCYPFSGAPREDVFHRWRKDLKRFNLLTEYYPVTDSVDSDSVASDSIASEATESKKILVRAEFGVPISGTEPAVALTGFAGYAALHAAARRAAALAGAEVQLPPALNLSVVDCTIEVEIPGGAIAEIVVAAPAPEVATSGKAIEYEPYGDTYPAYFRQGNATVLSTRGRLLAVAPLRLSTATQGSKPSTASEIILLATPQHILLYFLMWANRSSGAARAIYRAYYAHTLALLETAEKLLAAAGPAAFELTPFAPSVRTLGAVNTDAAYVIKMAGNAARLHDTPPAILGLEPDLRDILKGLPSNYYPARGRERPRFDPAECALYQRSGRELAIKQAAELAAEEP
jgi:hypothetical protein